MAKRSNLVLDAEYSILFKSHGVILVKTEQKEITDLDTFETKTVIKKDSRYYIKLRQALSAYVDDTLETSEDIKAVIERLGKLEKVIENIK